MDDELDAACEPLNGYIGFLLTMVLFNWGYDLFYHFSLHLSMFTALGSRAVAAYGWLEQWWM